MPNQTGLRVPPIHFINYVGNGVVGGLDVIMEYSLDANGIFQISVLEGLALTVIFNNLDRTVFYEPRTLTPIAMWKTTDLTDAAKDDKQALTFSADLTVGKVYYTGYDKSVKNTVVANL